MKSTATDRALVAEAIGDAFKKEEIEQLVSAATGHNLYVRYASAIDPIALAVSRTLEALEEEGTERWLLTYVLIRALANEDLRKLIVGLYPETLRSLPSMDQLVERVLQNLLWLKNIILAADFRHRLNDSRHKISAISNAIRTLSVNKTLHECLHRLDLQLAFRSTRIADEHSLLKDIEECQQEIERSYSEALAALSPIGMNSSEAIIELIWIRALEQLAARIKSALNASDSDAAAGFLSEAQRLIRLQLCRLNESIFITANLLSLDKLIALLPPESKREEAFELLSHSIRDLTPTVLARALVHKIWQDVDNEISLVGEFFDTSEKEAHLFDEYWSPLRSRILWLGTLDPNAEWSKEAKRETDEIDDQLADEEFSDKLKELFYSCCRHTRYRFFAIDATLKLDYSSLGRIEAPLTSILEGRR
jgi:hypothetical protein